jgi:hypothetical protein
MRYQARRSNWGVGAVVEDTHTKKAICSCSFDDNAAVQIAAALNVAERLPLSEDGVRVAPNDTVYQIDPAGMINSPPGMRGVDPNPRPWRSTIGNLRGNAFFVPGMPFFSTKEAALESLKP